MNLSRPKSLVALVTENGSGSTPRALTYDWTKNGGHIWTRPVSKSFRRLALFRKRRMHISGLEN